VASVNIPFCAPRFCGPRGLHRPRRWLPLALLGCALPAMAQLTPELLAQAQTLARDAAAALAPAAARVEVEAGVLDPRLTLAPCARVEPYLATGVPAWGRTRVGLRCTDGRVRWNVFLPLTVRVWAPALVSSASLPAGARLTEGQLVRADTDWGAASQAPFVLPAALEGRTLARAVAAGQALRAADLQPRVWFVTGDTVQIMASGNGFAITADGKALTPGLEGQTARVRTDAGGILVGRPVGERRMEVGL
jgi:flagella basal body P-ring formation protein FlgA